MACDPWHFLLDSGRKSLDDSFKIEAVYLPNIGTNPCVLMYLSRDEVVFPNAFRCYQDRSRKVYGCIVISSDNNILLVKGRLSQKWSFPKGHMEGKETSLQCATRELQEETGLCLMTEPISFKKYSAAGYFIYSVENEARLFPKDTREIDDARWFSYEEISNLNKNVDVSMFYSHVLKVMDT